MSRHDVRGTWPQHGHQGSPLGRNPLRAYVLVQLRSGVTICGVARDIGCSSRTLHRFLERDPVAASARDMGRGVRQARVLAHHGTVSSYKRCHCQSCRGANAAAARSRRARTAVA